MVGVAVSDVPPVETDREVVISYTTAMSVADR